MIFANPELPVRLVKFNCTRFGYGRILPGESGFHRMDKINPIATAEILRIL